MEDNFRIDNFRFSETNRWIQEAARGRFLCGGGEPFPQGITTDSRLVLPGDLFIPLSGEKVDGHRFIPQAIDRGATTILTSAKNKPQTTAQVAVIEVDDTLEALARIANAWRRRFDIPVVGITGAAGKTTTKNMVTTIVREVGEPHKTWKNWNNEIGVPLTLLGLREHHTHAIIEMGMNAFGEIRYLTATAEPQIRIITNVMPVHLEGVGDVNGVAKAKAEILEGATTETVFVVNLDDPFIPTLANAVDCRKLTFSTQDKQADVYLIQEEQLADDGTRGQISIGGNSHAFTLKLTGDHNVNNMLAAVATCHALNIDSKSIIEGIAKATPESQRGEWLHLKNNVRLFNDCYNANPGSMQAAFSVAKRFSEGSNIAVLGDMLELGDASAALHLEVLEGGLEQNFAKIFCFGPFFKAAAAKIDSKKIAAFDDIQALCQHLLSELADDALVLVKGSRGMQMERVSEFLKQKLVKET